MEGREMPRVKAGHRQMTAQVPDDVYEAMDALAQANGRALVDELLHAMRRHIAQPPRVRTVVEEPTLDPADIDQGPGHKKRGRKPGSTAKPRASKPKGGAK